MIVDAPSPHPDLLMGWAQGLDGPEARHALARCPRVGARVRAAVWRGAFGHHGAAPEIEDGALARAAAHAGPAFLARVGLYWHAPALAPALLTAAGRAAFGALTREELEGVVRHRGHAAPELVGRPEDREGCEEEGTRCLHAWLDRFPAREADVVRLALPHRAPEPEGVGLCRAALLAAVLAEEGVA